MPEMDNIWNSKMRRNFTEITNDIRFSGGSDTSTESSLIGPIVGIVVAAVILVIVIVIGIVCCCCDES